MNIIIYNSRYLRTLLLLMVLSLFTAVCKPQQSEVHPSGKIDISNFDFTRDDVIELNGPWEFYWERFLYPGDFKGSARPVPDGYSSGLVTWKTIQTTGATPGAYGYATYRLRILLPERPPGMGIRITFQNSSFRLIINGEEVALSGKPGTGEENTVPARTNRVVYFQPHEREMEIILHVANYYVFRGGLRGVIQLGSADAIEGARNRRLALDLIVAGFGLGIWLYHLFLFLQRPQDRSILYFLFLSGSFLPRYFLVNERTLFLLINEFSLDFEIRLIQSLNVLTPALLLLFMRSIFPESIKLRTVLFLFLSSLFYFGTWFFSARIHTIAYIFYLIFAIIYDSVPIGFALFQAVKIKMRGALFQSIGILLFAVLLVIAFTRVILGESAGYLALFAFTSLSFFQALFLSVSYTEKMRTNLFMAEQLHESRKALAKQREELELNLHDALGGSLTDLKIFAERIRNDIPRRLWPNAIGKLDRKISDMIRSFRTQLLFMEDMELASAELFTGLHMALLRRYSDAGRELIFEISDLGDSQNDMNPKNAWFHLLFLAMEICTNDLKYGIGESIWRIVRKGNDLLILQENQIARLKKDAATGKRIVERTSLMGGVVKSTIRKNRLAIEIFLPNFWGDSV